MLAEPAPAPPHVPRESPMPERLRTLATLVVLALLAAAQAQQITAWVIDGESERPYFVQVQEAFNAAYADRGISVDVVRLPNINDALQAGFLGASLPDVVMVDGPNMAAYVWSGQLAPLDPYLSQDLRDDLLPAIVDQGTYSPDGLIYAISPYDSSVLLWGNRGYLEQAGVRIPESVADAWTFEEMEAALEALAQVPGVTWPLDMKLNYTGEWYAYGFSPFLQACGADLIDRDTWQASGTLDAPAAVTSLQRLQAWSANGWIVPSAAGDNRFFGDKTAALAWVGNWMWRVHVEGLGDDLVLIPAPKFCGDLQASPNGGWSYAIPAVAANKDAAGEFIAFAMSTEQVALYADTTGYVPARASAIALSELYGPGGQGALMAEQSATIAVVRPVHPAYPVISAAFERAVTNILDGADVATELARAARAIDDDIADSDGYPPFGGR
jgi:multiple sugar transport system substrate-binding protein